MRVQRCGRQASLGAVRNFLFMLVVSTLSFFAPAKINLFLAITGQRPDGYHNLVSVVAPLAWGDTLSVEGTAAEWSLDCDVGDVPVDETNLVLKAARAFARATGAVGGARFRLEKRIPMGAGLGGGSSDAVAALRALNELAGQPLGADGLAALAAKLGSDCPLFLWDGPVVMRGRGERVTPLPANAAARLRGRRVLVFKPAFGISTPWAYAQLAAQAPALYLSEPEAEGTLARWLEDLHAPAEALLLNSMEAAAFRKYVALPTLLAEIRSRFGHAPSLSGSGSACYVMLQDDTDVAPLIAVIREAWGESAYVLDTRLL